MKKTISLFLIFFLFVTATVSADYADTKRYLLSQVSDPAISSVGGEWTVIGLAKSGDTGLSDYFSRYTQNVLSVLSEKNGVLHIERSRNSIIGVSRNPMAEQYPVGTMLPVWFDPQKPQRSYVLRCPPNQWVFWLLFLFGLVVWLACALVLILL